jgi:hypothetical protein
VTSNLVESKGGWVRVAVTLAILAVCIGLFSVHYRLPGLFMDSINPEYLAAKLLSETGTEGFKAWILPGNLILGKYPVLAGSYYHGPLQLYLSLPVYMVMGFSIESARTAQCLYALAILLVSSRLLVRAGVGNTLLLVGLVLLALDPGFVHVFKTQGLSNLWPLSLYLLSLLLVDRVDKPKKSWLLVPAGVLLGLAFFSYFLYLFFAPVAFGYAIIRLIQSGRGPASALRTSSMLVVGFLIGSLPYFVGFYLLYSELGSLSAFSAQLHAGASQLEVIRAPSGLSTLTDMANDLSSAVTDLWVNTSVLGRPGRVTRPWPAAILFLGTPFVLGGLLAYRKVPARFLHVVNASIGIYLLASLAFAARFDGHHYVMLLPLGYLAWILAVHHLLQVQLALRPRRWLIIASFALAACWMAGSIQGQVIYLRELVRTGGVGTFSDALDRFADDAGQGDPDTIYYLPDWGFMMPLQFLTAGSVVVEPEEPTASDIRRLVCTGRTVAVVYDLGNPDSAKAVALHEGRLEAFRKMAPGSHVAKRNYLGREGTREFTVATLSSDGVSSAWCGAERVPKCEISTQPDVTIAAEPCDIRRCPKPAGRRPEVRFSWDATAKTDTVEVWVGDASGKKLWVRSEAKGQDTTGPWAFPGMEFEVRDARTGTALANAKIGGRDCAL